MFVGHLGLALGAKNIEPQLPVAALVAASFGLDLLWPLFLLSGLESVRIDPGNTRFTALAFDNYPWSHSLAMAFLWGVLAALLCWSALRNARASVLIGSVVVSHWLLDFITHRPDLPLWPGGPEVGLGLWNTIPGTIVVEGALFAATVAVYVRTGSVRSAAGRWALWGLVGLCSLIWISQPWSPPPPSSAAVAIVALSLWIFPVWATWIESPHRGSRR